VWGLAVAVVVAAAVAVSAHCWRRGANALSLAPISAASVFGGLVVYGIIAPAENELHSHRALAERLERLVAPPNSHDHVLQRNRRRTLVLLE
jgi:hypothetical protein